MTLLDGQNIITCLCYQLHDVNFDLLVTEILSLWTFAFIILFTDKISQNISRRELKALKIVLLIVFMYSVVPKVQEKIMVHPVFGIRDAPINIRKLFKKSIKRKIAENLLIPMAPNCKYKKEDIADTAIFSVSNNYSIEYGSKYLRSRGKKIPSSDDMFYHLSKLGRSEVIRLFKRVNDHLLREAKRRGCFQEEGVVRTGYP